MYDKRVATILLSGMLAAASPAVAKAKQIPLQAFSELETKITKQKGDTVEAEKLKEDISQESAEKSFLGINFGLGIGVSIDLDSGDQVDEAILDENGIVRVKKESNEDPRVVLEIHKFFEPGPGCYTVTESDKTFLTVGEAKSKLGSYSVPRGCDGQTGDNDPAVFRGKDRLTPWGHGPFAAIQASNDNAISAFGIGYMIGWRRQNAANSSSNSFNLGVGFVYDREVQTLGDGVVANAPLPSGETTIRLKQEPRLGLMVITSFSF